MPRPITRRRFNSLALFTGAAFALPIRLLAAKGSAPSAFLHPGLLQCSEDLARIRAAIQSKREPIYAGFKVFRDDPRSRLDYKPAGASEEIGRNPGVRIAAFDSDSNAAYQCALRWCLTGDRKYGELAALILNDWAATLKRITGADAILCASLGGFKMVNAAELLRYGGDVWSSVDAERFAAMLRAVFLPVVINFAPFANGNWDTAAIKLMLAIAVYTNDRELFDRSLVYYIHGCGDGRLDHYIYPGGQCQESGRDQQHTQLGLAHMGDACEIAWHQGLDLYAALDSRLAAGFEYTACYNLGGNVQFTPDVDFTGKYRHKSISPPGPLRPGFEQIYNHYANRRGRQMPWTAKAAQKLRPEGSNLQGADHTGFGTLLYTRDVGPDTAAFANTAQPSGLHIAPNGNALRVFWVPPASLPCTVARAEYGSQKFAAVTHNITNGIFIDSTVHPGRHYIYRIIPDGRAPSSLPVSAVAGLPSGWTATIIGDRSQASEAGYDGVIWHLTGGGSALQPEAGGDLFCVHAGLPRRGTLTARLNPFFASQFLRAGLALFDNTSAELPAALLLLHPGGGTDIEHPTWSVSLYARDTVSGALLRRGESLLTSPQISWGRVSHPLWFRVEIMQDVVHASISSDGEEWKIVGSTPAHPEPLRAGLALSSGLADISAEVFFDHVEIAPST